MAQFRGWMSCPRVPSMCSGSGVNALYAAALAIMLLLLAGCSGESSGNSHAKGQPARMAIPVDVATAIQKPAPVQVRAIGNVEPVATVAVKARISGELMSVHFVEGQYVKKGDLLFTIDPRPFEARLRQAEANLARDRAQLENARIQTERYGAIVKKGYVSREEFDKVRTEASALEAVVRADEAAVENARLDLKYCYIRSAINGYAGDLKVDPGNIVKADDLDNPLVTINQTDPIDVVFSVPEALLPRLRRHMAERRLEVQASAPGDMSPSAAGELTFLDNEVNTATGTIRLKATFPNEEKTLWPGQFVNVVVTLMTQPDAVVVPAQAVQTGQEGQYVFVVKPDLTVEFRPVTAGRIIGGEAVIEQGISPGETVVTDGQLRLGSGTLVKVVEKSDKALKEAVQ